MKIFLKKDFSLVNSIENWYIICANSAEEAADKWNKSRNDRIFPESMKFIGDTSQNNNIFHIGKFDEME